MEKPNQLNGIKESQMADSNNNESTQQVTPTSKNPEEFRKQFLSIVRNGCIASNMQRFLLKNRTIISDKLIMDINNYQPKLYDKFRYLMLTLSMSSDKNQKWATFYQLINSILKIPKQIRFTLAIEKHVINFTYFLLDQIDIFFLQFPLIKEQMLKSSITVKNISNNQQWKKLQVKKIVKIFNSLLCLKFITIQDLLVLIYHSGVKSHNYTEFLISIEQNFVKRMVQFQKMQQSKQTQSEGTLSSIVLDVSKIYVILHIFYNLDPQNKLRQLLAKQLGDSHQKAFKLGNYQIQQNKLQKIQKKNEEIKNQRLLKFIINEVLKNKQMQIKIKKQFIITCFQQIKQIDQLFFQNILDAESCQENQQISQILIKFIQRQSLNFISVSRLRSILKIINLPNKLNYEKTMGKIYKILDIVQLISKKFNTPHPTYLLQLNSIFKITNMSKAVMIIFSVDFFKPQTGRVIQFVINKIQYDIFVKYSQNDSYSIQIIIQGDGNQKYKYKKQIRKWSFVLFMISLTSKQQMIISVDGKQFIIQLKKSGSQITTAIFGPFYGSIKDVYILDKNQNLKQLNQKYQKCFRKMDQLLDELGHKNYIYSFGKQKKKQGFSLFRKQMVVQSNLKKLRQISFGQGLQQLGGFSALFFLASRIINNQKNYQLVKFLIKFFQLFQVIINQCQLKQALKWMLVSTPYFGQFLWLIINKNQHLAYQSEMFKKIFGIFNWFHKLPLPEHQKLLIDLAIIQDIYLNFQIWSICSYEIKNMLLTQLQLRLKSPEILLRLQNDKQNNRQNNKGYQKIMSSIVFSFKQENIQQNFSAQHYMEIPISSIHTRISAIGERFFDLHCVEKKKDNSQIIKKDMNTIIGLIYTFFYKQHLQFGSAQMSALTVLLVHYSYNFRKLMQKQQIKIDIINQFATYIQMCPFQCQAIALLFQIGLDLIVKMEYSKGIGIIIDALITRIQTSNSEQLQFPFKVYIHIIKKSKVIYQPNSTFDDQQIISVLLGSLRNQAQKAKNKLKYWSLTRQFKNFEIDKLGILMSITQFYMFISQCVNQQHLFSTAVFFLKLIIQNTRLFPQGSKLVMCCLKIINNTANVIKNNQGSNEKDKQKENEKDKQVQKIQKISQFTLGKKTKQTKQFQPSINQSKQILKQILSFNNLQLLYKNCRSTLLFQTLIKLNIFCLPITNFQFPLQLEIWEASVKNYGGDLAHLYNLTPFTIQQLSLLIKIIQQRLTFAQQKNLLKDILHHYLPLLILFNVWFKIFNGNVVQSEFSELKQINKQIYDYLKLKQLLHFFTILKNNKPTLIQLLKIQNSNEQLRINEIINTSKIIQQQYNTKIISQNISLQNQIYLLKNKLDKQIWSDKFFATLQKQIKCILQKVKEIIQTLKLLILAVAKSNTTGQQKIVPMLSSRKREQRQNKRNKNQQLAQGQRKQYQNNLKKMIKDLSLQLQQMSKKKQKMWKNLIQKNKFWTSTKIKNNQCYQIDQKVTGFYRLNIIKRVFGDVPYPRRKSFQHELEQENAAQSEVKIKQTEYPAKPSFANQFNRLSEDPTKNDHPPINPVKQPPKPQPTKLPKQSFFVQYVTQKGVYAGRLLFEQSQNSFIFQCQGYNSLPKKPVYQYSTIHHRKDQKQDRKYRIKIPINSKSQIFARRYIQRHTAIQIFSYHHFYFFNLFLTQEKDRFFKIYSSRITCIADLRAQFQRRKYTEKWRYGKLDNFQYLMLINMFSGRTYNDLGQYPVVPWVIRTYGFDEVQINKQFIKNQSNIRDLSKPIGKIGQNKFKGMLQRYKQIEDQDEQSKFLYGTMYSNPTVIYNFFIRLQPFTSLHWQHQGRRIDHADRLFSTVFGQFNTLLTSTSDNKQLTPQFYYWPQFLKNRNKVNLGTKQNKQQVDDVQLPGWSKNPQQFIFKMRQVLQSLQISKNIHKWIDLIFGYKSNRQVGKKYDNVFHFKTYQHDIFQKRQQQLTVNQIKTQQITISQFGQIPYPIFIQAHPQKQLYQFQDLFKLGSSMNVKKPDNTQLKILQMCSTDQGFFIAYDTQVQFYPIQNNKFINFSKPDKTYQSKGQHIKLYDFKNNIWLTLQQGIFRIFDKKKIILQQQIQAQCFALYNRYVIFGDKSELVVKTIQNNFQLSKVNSFYGHKNKICHIQVNGQLDIMLSIDQDGLVLIHQFQQQRFLRQFDLETKQPIVNICIHQMGYFIFLTKDQKLIIFSFLGELFFNQSIGVTNKAISEQITKIKIFLQNRSILLMSTNLGKVFLVDFLQIKRFNENCLYKQYSRFKTNIFENCPRLSGTNSNMSIKNFFIKQAIGQKTLAHRIYVLYQNNSIVHYYPAQKLQEKLKHNKALNGIFQFEKTKQGRQKSFKIQSLSQ